MKMQTSGPVIVSQKDLSEWLVMSLLRRAAPEATARIWQKGERHFISIHYPAGGVIQAVGPTWCNVYDAVKQMLVKRAADIRDNGGAR